MNFPRIIREFPKLHYGFFVLPRHQTIHRCHPECGTGQNIRQDGKNLLQNKIVIQTQRKPFFKPHDTRRHGFRRNFPSFPSQNNLKRATIRHGLHDNNT